MDNKFKYHQDRTLSEHGEIFVFGSNLAGRHGAGAAKIAAEQYGAMYGIGFGFWGNSWAIPTKNFKIKTIPLNIIEEYIYMFVKYTHDHPNNKFFVTRVGCGLAGYKDEEIAPLFGQCNTNCNFPIEWKQYLE